MGSPRKCSAVLFSIDLSRNQDVRSTSSNCRRTVPDPTMRAAFTDIGCKMFWRSECLPNTTMQCYGCRCVDPTRRSCDPAHSRHSRSRRSRRSRHSRGRPAISVGFGPVSDPDPTVIGGEHDLGRIWSARSGPRRRAPTFGYARTRHRRVGEDPPRVDHEGGLRTQRFRRGNGPSDQVGCSPSIPESPDFRARPTHPNNGSPPPCWRRPQRASRHIDRRRTCGESLALPPIPSMSSPHDARRCVI